MVGYGIYALLVAFYSHANYVILHQLFSYSAFAFTSGHIVLHMSVSQPCFQSLGLDIFTSVTIWERGWLPCNIVISAWLVDIAFYIHSMFVLILPVFFFKLILGHCIIRYDMGIVFSIQY